ncbi:MAG: hypothetical protein ACI4AX_02715, partial [Muribaculaceae bacterium]
QNIQFSGALTKGGSATPSPKRLQPVLLKFFAELGEVWSEGFNPRSQLIVLQRLKPLLHIA